MIRSNVLYAKLEWQHVSCNVLYDVLYVLYDVLYESADRSSNFGTRARTFYLQGTTNELPMVSENDATLQVLLPHGWLQLSRAECPRRQHQTLAERACGCSTPLFRITASWKQALCDAAALCTPQHSRGGAPSSKPFVAEPRSTRRSHRGILREVNRLDLHLLLRGHRLLALVSSGVVVLEHDVLPLGAHLLSTTPCCIHAIRDQKQKRCRTTGRREAGLERLALTLADARLHSRHTTPQAEEMHKTPGSNL